MNSLSEHQEEDIGKARKKAIRCVNDKAKINACFKKFDLVYSDWMHARPKKDESNNAKKKRICKQIFCEPKETKDCLVKCKNMVGGDKSYRIVQVSVGAPRLIEKAAVLMTQMYGKGSHYSKWISNGFRPYDVTYVLSQVKNSLRRLFVMLDGENVIATIILQKKNKSTCIIHKFCADPRYKGQGVGLKLLRHIERVARQDGMIKAQVEVFSAADRLLNYYAAKGYNHFVEMVPLLESDYIKYKCHGASYGFITLQKQL